MAGLPTYVLITPARNEAQFIELTIRSVVAQTVRPLRWVIVSDGSTDGTDEIVEKYAQQHPWIELVSRPRRADRNFSGKVQAFRAGYERVTHLDWDVVASLDGDITFDEQYFSFLLERLAADPALGLVGTPFQEEGSPIYDYKFVSIEHVSGACQVFRRRCFEEIGGYTPIKGGGIDYVAVLSSRMKGWKTRTFTDRVCHHHRPMGTAQNSLVAARFKTGRKDYVLGSHPLWILFRAAYQMTNKPLVIGGAALFAGYVLSWLRRAERPISREMVVFRRREEMSRLRQFFKKRAGGSPKPAGSAVSRSASLG